MVLLGDPEIGHPVEDSVQRDAKVIRLVAPENPSPGSIRAGQVLGTERVMIEVNTLFEQLVSVLSTIQPEKLNETLGAIGQTLGDLNSVLAQLNPHLDALNQDLAATPAVLSAYADAAPDLLSIADSATQIGHTVVDRQEDFDELLVSAIGLGDIGNQVLSENRHRWLTITMPFTLTRIG